MSALANMPDMHSSIYSIMQDNLKSELKYYPVLGFSDAGFFSKKTLGLCHKPHKTLIIQNFALQSGYAAASIFRTLLRKTVCDRRIFLCGSLVKAFCYAKRSIVKILLRKTAYSVSGLRCFWPPRFLRGAYFAVHCFDSNFDKLHFLNVVLKKDYN